MKSAKEIPSLHDPPKMPSLKESLAQNAALDLKGHTAIVTGGTSGIGHGIALRLGTRFFPPSIHRTNEEPQRPSKRCFTPIPPLHFPLVFHAQPRPTSR